MQYLWTTMSATKPADLTLALQKATKVFTAIVDRPTDNDIINIPQYINAIEAAQRKSKHGKLVITDNCMHTVAVKFLLQSGEYETETREWPKLQETKQTWTKCKTTFPETYVGKRRSEAAREGEEKPFVDSVTFGATDKTQTKGAQLTHQMMDFLEGYLNNIAAAATQTADPSGTLADLAASLVV